MRHERPPPRNFCRAGTNLHLNPVKGAKYSAIITGSQCVKADKKKSFTVNREHYTKNKKYLIFIFFINSHIKLE